MNNQPLLYGIIGLVMGMIIVGFTTSYAVNNNNTGVMGMMGIRSNYAGSTDSTMMGSDATPHAGMGMSMDDMMRGLNNKTGDDFDKAFLSEMIDHHKGAIDMAKDAQTNAKHQEVKDLAGKIITAQTTEIAQMQAWQKSWGY